MTVIPFYGTDRPDMFALERAAMDPEAKVVRALNDMLPPSGVVLDVGAGDGFAAELLTTRERTVVPMEPASAMIDSRRTLPWVQGDVEALPFSTGSFDAAYATWAYFFSRDWDPSPGLAELHRAVRAGGPIAIVDNLGDDDFTPLAREDLTADPDYWSSRGFTCRSVGTSFEFDDVATAQRLLGWYFGAQGAAAGTRQLSYTYNVGLFEGVSRGPDGSTNTPTEST